MTIGVWLGSALFAGGVAASRHRRVWSWSLIGLLFGLIGVSIASSVSAKPKRRREPERAPRAVLHAVHEGSVV